MGRRPAVIGALTVYTCLFHAGNILLRDHGFAVHVWADAGWTIIAAAGAWKCWHTSRRVPTPELRRAWRWIAAGCFSWFVGMLIWNYLELVRRVITPFPSPGQVFFLGLVPLMVAGFFSYRTGPTSEPVTLKQLGDLGVVTCTMLMVCTILLYQPTLVSDSSRLYVATALAYPVIHIAGVLFGLICFWQSVRGRRRRVLLWLILGLACLTVVATLYAMSLLKHRYASGGNLDVLWVMTFVAIIYAAFEEDWIGQEPDAGEQARIPRLDTIVPVVAVSSVGVTIVTFPDHWSVELSPVIGAGLVGLALALGVRHRGSMLIERRLNRDLEELNEELEARVTARTLELADARDAAEAASRSKTDFLANMSHELRTPLTAIIGYAELLSEDFEGRGAAGAPDDGSDLKQIELAGRQLLELINELLDLSKVESGRLELSFEPVELRLLIEQVAASVGPMIARGGNELRVSIAPDVPLLRTDAIRLRQVLLNLLSNAAKFTSDGVVSIEVSTAGSHVELTVRDTGIGLSDSQAARIFEPFQQAKASTAREFGGTGLGLSISRTLCHALGGSLMLDSTQGQGSAFTVVLPLDAGA